MCNSISAFFLFIPLTIFCQKDSSSVSKISFGLTFSPDYCYRTLKSDESHIGNFIVNYRDSIEIPKFGYTTGINIGWNINNRIAFETGFLYSDKGEKTKKIEMHPLVPEPGIPENISQNYHYVYFDVPVKITYIIFSNRLKFYYTAGVSTNILIKNYNTSIWEFSDRIETKTSPSNSGYSKINLAIITGFGLNYAVSRKFFFRAEPVYRRSLTSIIDAPIKGYLYSYGINTGIFYKI